MQEITKQSSQSGKFLVPGGSRPDAKTGDQLAVITKLPNIPSHLGSSIGVERSTQSRVGSQMTAKGAFRDSDFQGVAVGP